MAPPITWKNINVPNVAKDVAIMSAAFNKSINQAGNSFEDTIKRQEAERLNTFARQKHDNTADLLTQLQDADYSTLLDSQYDTGQLDKKYGVGYDSSAVSNARSTALKQKERDIVNTMISSINDPTLQASGRAKQFDTILQRYKVPTEQYAAFKKAAETTGADKFEGLRASYVNNIGRTLMDTVRNDPVAGMNALYKSGATPAEQQQILNGWQAVGITPLQNKIAQRNFNVEANIAKAKDAYTAETQDLVNEINAVKTTLAPHQEYFKTLATKAADFRSAPSGELADKMFGEINREWLANNIDTKNVDTQLKKLRKSHLPEQIAQGIVWGALSEIGSNRGGGLTGPSMVKHFVSRVEELSKQYTDTMTQEKILNGLETMYAQDTQNVANKINLYKLKSNTIQGVNIPGLTLPPSRAVAQLKHMKEVKAKADAKAEEFRLKKLAKQKAKEQQEQKEQQEKEMNTFSGIEIPTQFSAPSPTRSTYSLRDKDDAKKEAELINLFKKNLPSF